MSSLDEQLDLIPAPKTQRRGKAQTRHAELVRAIELALRALDSAPRFTVYGAPAEFRDSYQVCSELERVLREWERDD